MKKLLLHSLLLALAAFASACASSKTDKGPASVTLVRAGGFSGLEERYTIESSGHATKTMRWPGKQETTMIDTTLPAGSIAGIFNFLDRNIDSLRAIRNDKAGNMTTTLILLKNTQAHIIRWPNLEPPILSTNKLDSMYALVAPVEQWLSSSQ
jgi:hypothetical protein